MITRSWLGESVAKLVRRIVGAKVVAQTLDEVKADYIAGVVAWHRDRDDTWGTHRWVYDKKTGDISLMSGHYNLTQRSMLNDLSDRQKG